MEGVCNSPSYKRFFTVIDRPESNFMLIPEEFAMKHLTPLLEPVEVKTNDGLSWCMSLVDGPYGLALKDGWCEFRDRYNLQVNQLIFFTVAGGSVFYATMFDYDSGCEILGNNGNAAITGNVSITSGDISCASNKGVSVRSNAEGEESSIIPGIPISQSVIDGIRMELKSKEPLEIERVPRLPRKWFFVVIQEEYVSGLYRMYIPLDFAATNLDFGRNLRFCYVPGTQRMWEVTCSSHGGGARITRGWKEFAQYNNISTNQGWTVNVCPIEESVWIFIKN